MNSSQLYYLLDLHLSCENSLKYGDKYINKYIEHINISLNKYFSDKEQKQLKLYNFNYNLMYDIAIGNLPENISFENINPIKLHNFFDSLICIEIKE
jgi:hypothetical protein